jgi:hypothetical protein
VVIALAGNKADMEAKRKVQTEEAQQYAQENDIIFLETSAKTALNVRNLFVEIGAIRWSLLRYWLGVLNLVVCHHTAKKLPKTPLVAERESFPIVPPKGKDKSGCC